jgi:pimeloyl-ACP methyl ester carboxylesterase
MTEPITRPAETHRITHLHGRDVAYRDLPGGGVPLLLIHGVGSSMATWGDVPERINAAGRRVVLVDLPGHGDSSRERGDYSLGSMASTLRDLLDELSIPVVNLVGHSLGGGIAMQFTYQFPDRVAAIVLESSGGLGEEAFAGLRAASIPGSEVAISWAINRRTLGGAAWVGRALARVGVTPHALTPSALETVSLLAEPDRRAAFLSTLRSVVGPGGQRVSALEKLHLMAGDRMMIIWGDHDPMIPIAHGRDAHDRLPGSRFVVFPGASHEAHAHDPERFADLVVEHVSRADCSSS